MQTQCASLIAHALNIVGLPDKAVSEARERVLALIDTLAIGDAIPSERQLSADLGFSPIDPHIRVG